MAEWKAFYNYHRPHGGLKGKTPYKTLVEKMKA
ncbi:integrase core domain-containing protein [Xenorhabdus budapestensis]|uniref:Integrase core domain-containing protein n=1 Tax=Xenorhabdus budapestensis TaxID=290110 RepID=A0ABX7VCD7_XENBU|nr:integrase core domain-containing protein [Xenorhabdus budapestensis]